MRLFAGMEVFVFRVIVLTFMAQMANADAYNSAQRALENLKKNCYPDINAESLVVPQISIEAVFTKVIIGNNETTEAFIVNPEHLTCGGKSAGLCGSRGCDIEIFAGTERFSYIGWQPQVLSIDNSNFLLQPHQGWVCGQGPNSDPCFSVLFWSDFEKKFVYRYGNVE